MSDVTHAPAAADSSQTIPTIEQAKNELPPWLRRILLVAGILGPFVGAGIGSAVTSQDADVLGLVREVISEIKGPLGGYILAFLMLVALSWHHLRTLANHAQERKDRSASTARVADKLEKRISEKDEKLEEAGEKTLSVFKGTVGRYEKVLSEVNARTDIQAQQLVEIRTDLKAIRDRIEGLTG